MPKVACAEIDCKHNADGRCKAPKVSLSAEGVCTTYHGFRQFWSCKTYEMSEEAKQLYKELKDLEVC